MAQENTVPCIYFTQVRILPDTILCKYYNMVGKFYSGKMKTWAIFT
ncbi:hypothetical protein BD94_1542 [Elizabethkingia anophelis NUHP1]|uniref:Uncharacterized protein n=2 Tax=Elizabethkingia anophelis TaxID=1117645 RepID=A0A455ZGC5_9FLAO|nr:hypothetical protein BD94_1542 [Elizabethkingia anophelis NUHP1]DAC75909.1 TPA_exp: hypothetical protein [Elizabethkingia anophelis]DAC75999.1 TPA_exp: hypothetical protein [Elizabethkingia anophelis]DAC76546.1 TPA_exp: hypothetical protein [Elizabethkingia anophelis]